ncbi:MAG: gamma-butyrobetaine hydroxylase-like domain-containing protein [Pontibacterium sp.]
MNHPTLPTDIRLHKKSRTLELVYADQCFELTAEFLRVHSPSAEVRGHGVGNGVLQTNKKLVAMTGIQPAGNYALKISFDDGHDSGLYTWEYLYDLCHNQAAYWQRYLEALKEADKSRDGGLIARG